MALTNQIQNFKFLDLIGPPGTSAEQVEIIARAGVDDVEVWLTGRRGAPFQMASRVDVPTLDNAFVALEQYIGLIGQDPQPLIWHGVDMESTSQLKFAVLSVQSQRIYQTRTFVGGLFPPSLAMLECVWSLIPVRTS